jgi:hypothetical protein
VQVILHIGTHKTGTSALQDFLRRNERVLARKNIYYARMAPSRNLNHLAKMVSKTRVPEIKAYFRSHIDKARARGAHTVVMSAESFYAMTMFFHKFNGRQIEYWNSEAACVEFLHRTLPQGLPVRIVVFFRRQDHFLESIYATVVTSRAVAMPIDEFAIFFREALDYRRHLEIWSDLFPDCAVFAYEQASKNISDFFLRNVLHLASTEEFDGLDARANVRLSRDVLEYKRMLNATHMSKVDRYLSGHACTELARFFPDDGAHHQYLAPHLRQALLQDMQSDNSLLSEKFAMAPFPLIVEDSRKDRLIYPGLSTERTRELAERYARIRMSTRYRIGRLSLLLRQFIRQRLPRLSWEIRFRRFLALRRNEP